jgi:hypothetical protein
LVQRLAPDAVAVLGDSQDERGELANFEAAYDPTWGRFKGITHPAVGNHEYQGAPRRNRAPGYFAYFGRAAHPRRGYYRWRLGRWTVFVLNSGNIQYTRTGRGARRRDDCWPVSCARGSRQVRWLRARLRALPRKSCVLAYWHHPRFSSGFGGAHQPHPETGPLFDALYDHGADLVLNGHVHNYERFRSVNPARRPARHGMTQFVVGTGGSGLHRKTGRPLTRTLRTGVFGVLELTLGARRWRARFVAEGGRTLEVGVRTELGKHLAQQFGADAEFWDARQCVLERLPDRRWQVSPVPGTANETLLNGEALASPRPLRDGDVLAVGRQAKGIVKLPLTVRAL